MREIKFQIYWVAGHEMLYDTNNDLEFRDKENYWITDLSDATNHPERYKVRQYTGLKDRDGVEIYEGDIVKHSTAFTFDKTATVIFRDGGFWLDRCLLFRCHDITVIGNQYETPDLLQ